ncbi:hypothetical protein GW17_00042671 [Ensete ventricosum]|nr:hypothetical protein GW17_00042671 [Ensete ventricosum]
MPLFSHRLPSKASSFSEVFMRLKALSSHPTLDDNLTLPRPLEEQRAAHYRSYHRHCVLGDLIDAFPRSAKGSDATTTVGRGWYHRR